MSPPALFPSSADTLSHPHDLLISQSSIPELVRCLLSRRAHYDDPLIRWQQCRRALCPVCSLASADDLRDEWEDRIMDDEPAVFARLSVESSHDLATGWRALQRTRQAFGKRAWLTTHSAAWMRTTEITLSRGLWNVHDNYIVTGSPSDLETVKVELAPRWASAAASVGVKASPAAQYVDHAASAGACRHYVLKRLMARSTGVRGQSPGDLLSAWAQGDADAAEAWEELEAFYLARPRSVRLISCSRPREEVRRRDLDLAA